MTNMNMSSLSFEDFADFIRSQCGISQKKKITPESKFEDDLGVTGDDGVDLLRATEERFGVRLLDAGHGYRRTFDLGPDEFLFNSEGWFPTPLGSRIQGGRPLQRCGEMSEPNGGNDGIRGANFHGFSNANDQLVGPLQHSRAVRLGFVLAEERAENDDRKHPLLGDSGSNSRHCD